MKPFEIPDGAYASITGGSVSSFRLDGHIISVEFHEGVRTFNAQDTITVAGEKITSRILGDAKSFSTNPAEPCELTIIFDPNNGVVLPDGKLYEWVDAWLDRIEGSPNDKEYVSVGSHTLISVFRHRIIEREIHDRITFQDEFGNRFKLNEYGVNHEMFTKGFADVGMDAVTAILMGAGNRRRLKKLPSQHE